MTNYLIRRLFQMALVVLLSSLAIYVLLNVAPGGPLSGLRITADRRQRVSEADIARLEAYLGLDKPLLLRYAAWVIGDDWMGADLMYLAPTRYKSPDGSQLRFWVAPGIAYIKPGYPLRIYGQTTGEAVVEATAIEVRPSGARPAEAIDAKTLKVEGTRLTVELGANQKIIVNTSPDTEFAVPYALARPTQGPWVDVSWLLGPHGLLGGWAGYHGSGAGILRLDWGTSWKIATGQPVLMLVRSRLGNTLLLMTLTTLLSLVVALPIGIYSAIRQYSRVDYAVTTFAFFGSAMPVFWFGLMMVLLFSYSFRNWGLPFLPAGGIASPRTPPGDSLLGLLSAAPDGFLDRAVHLLMPTTVLSLLYMAGWSRFMRSSMLEVLRQDYVRTARSKGLIERLVIGKHALRNALIPVITVVVFQIPTLFGGAILTETIFSYPGMGRLYFQALGASDWPVVMVLLFITAVLVVVAMLLRDILYTVVDPRIRFD